MNALGIVTRQRRLTGGQGKLGFLSAPFHTDSGASPVAKGSSASFPHLSTPTAAPHRWSREARLPRLVRLDRLVFTRSAALHTLCRSSQAAKWARAEGAVRHSAHAPLHGQALPPLALLYRRDKRCTDEL